MLASMPKTFYISPQDEEKVTLIYLALGKGKFWWRTNNLYFLTKALNVYFSTLSGNCSKFWKLEFDMVIS